MCSLHENFLSFPSLHILFVRSKKVCLFLIDYFLCCISTNIFDFQSLECVSKDESLQMIILGSKHNVRVLGGNKKKGTVLKKPDE